ncbi:MAG: efflux RND transporter permease subunit [Microbacteriaceae bacterium]
MHLLSVFSLRNRALIALVTIVVGIFGGVALTSLKQELIPSLSLPQLFIISTYPGASPQVVNDDVSIPIESAIQSVPGLDGTTAVSNANTSSITASFAYGTDITTAEQKVQLAINRINSQLPEGVDTQVLTFSLSDLPVIQIAITSDLDPRELADLLEKTTLPDLRDIDGVSDATLLGATSQRITITPDADELKDHGLTTQSIRDALKANGTLLPSGQITEDGKTLTVQAGAKIETLDALTAIPLLGATKSVTVTQPGFIPGAPATSTTQRVPDTKAFTLGQFADVKVIDNPVTGISRVNGKPSVTIAVTKNPAGNTVEVSRMVNEMVPGLEKSVGSNTKFTIVFDQAPFIEQSIESLTTEGLLGLLFAVIVILIFLLSIRSTLVTAISIPVSVLITFIGMLAAGYTLNIITLGALTIAIGRVVDDSIVVIENIKRHLGLGEEKMAAIKTAVREVAGAVTASTVTTVAVFLPLALVGDVTGELFRPFALTVTISLAASLFVALTIVPVLAYWFLGSTTRTEDQDLELRERAGRSFGWVAVRGVITGVVIAAIVAGAAVGALFAGDLWKGDYVLPIVLAAVVIVILVTGVWMLALVSARRRLAKPLPPAIAHTEDELDKPSRLQRGYLPVITWTLKRPVATLLIAVLVLGGTLALIPFMKTNFLGDSGQNTLTVSQTLPLGSSLEVRDDAAKKVEAMLVDVPGVEIVQLSLGTSGSSLRAAFSGGGSTSFSLTTDPDADQVKLQADVRAAIKRLSGVGEVAVAASGSGFASSNIAVNIKASGDKDLRDAADAVLSKVKGLDVVAEATSNLSVTQPFIQVKVDRKKAAAEGLSEVTVGGIIAEAMNPGTVGSVVIDEKTLSIYINNSAAPQTAAEIRAFPIPAADEDLTVADVATVEQVDGPSSITAIKGVRSATVTITPKSDDVGSASAKVAAAVNEAKLPAGASAVLGGVTSQQGDAFQQLGLALLVAILIVYVVMVATFRSLRQPLLLLVSVPFAATGAIALQVISGVPLGVASLIGVLMLIGIVVTNAIVLVDLINQYRERGMKVGEAILYGASRRLRPILMTALATIFALLPLGIGLTGKGGFISQPLAIVVIGGLVSSTLLTLIVLPTLYYIVEGRKERKTDARRARAAAESEGHHGAHALLN